MTGVALAPTASLSLSTLCADHFRGAAFPCTFQEASLALSIFLRRAVICPDVHEGEDSKKSLLHYLQQTLPFLRQMLPIPPTVQLGQGEGDVKIHGAGRYSLRCGHGKGEKQQSLPLDKHSEVPEMSR